MSSNGIAIKVENLSKQYQIYDNPIDRLKQTISRGRRKYYREFEALKDINFDILKGETIGIIGRNGSGKSTLLQIIAGTLMPTSGEINVYGRVAALLELGSGFNPEFTGRENVYLNGSILGLSKTEMDKRFDEIARFADIGSFMDQPVKTYSSGMYVRLAFAVSINVDADILIIDEALAVGDVFFQAKCYKKFEEYKQQGKTILLVSHDLSSIIKYCDRAILLHEGRLNEIGRPREVVDNYKKLLVNLHEHTDAIEVSDTSSEEHIGNRWNTFYQWNPEHLDYGSKLATITDFGVFDESNELTSNVERNHFCSIKFKVKFNEAISSPIFAITFKDLKGTEIAGTNTLIEDIYTGDYEIGNEVEVIFTQKMNLQGGNYLLSLGCTGFSGEELVVYHRLYDIINIQVFSSKLSVGYVDLETKINILSKQKVTV
ncbi:ABC transporter ATP-binding protein [Schinkia azotoformans]|uniref:ABC transporter n=1 Tax=Schinkia azotoformans LMG 9581 TaxID=1131731 RepID=K6DPT1_SCHAZ|nr:ABC transporter ATP-binding protein [Schinkia azotoformans]EKN62796.1 ABC transporter [Schinkia azotoformans LMG 9581]MEC1639171.1 ABC transporter ATP-binding protein [Schinkia azotoformans]MEC1945759.1 ABC transporter ATP-binding protein [Schinkia azotoformans]